MWELNIEVKFFIQNENQKEIAQKILKRTNKKFKWKNCNKNFKRDKLLQSRGLSSKIS